MAKKQKDQKKKSSFGRRLIPLAMGAVLAVTPFMLAGCSNGQDGKDGAAGSQWHYGIEDPTNDIGKVGDFYLETDDGDIWVKTENGWGSQPVGNIKGPQGETGVGTPGQSATQYYTYVRYATDANGTGCSADPTGCNYISILTTTKTSDEIEDTDFTVWVKFVGENGNKGDTGVGSYTYIAFASDTNGTGFSRTHTEGLDYIGILTTNTEIENPQATDFTGKWIKFVGEDGKDGEDGLTPYIGYDGYFWYGDQRSEHKVVETLSDDVAENTIGLAGNEYFDNYSIPAGTSIALMSNYFPTIKQSAYSGVAIGSIQVYAESAGTLTISTASVADIVNRDGSTAVTLNNIIQKTLVQGLNTITFEELIIPETDTLVLGATGDTASLVAYKGINQNDEQGLFTELSETGLYKQSIAGINDKVVLKVETTLIAQEPEEVFAGLQTEIDGISATDWKQLKASAAPFMHINTSEFAGKTVSHIDVRAYSHTAQSSDDVYMSVYKINKLTAALIDTYTFRANPDDITGQSLNKMLTLTCDEEVSLNANETLAFGAETDTLTYCYYAPGSNYTNNVSGGYTGVKGWTMGTPNPNGLLAVNVYAGESLSSADWTERLTELQKQEQLAIEKGPLYVALSGKTLSIMGDSISTYAGVSNDTNANSTIGSNETYYNTSGKDTTLALTDTWWQQVIDNYDMDLLVNNSYSGSSVLGKGQACGERANNLDSNTNEKADVIAVYIGVNDFGNNKDCGEITSGYNWAGIENGTTTPTTFDQGYALMMYKIKQDNPNSDIFCFTIPYCNKTTDETTKAKLDTFNNAIRAIATHYGFDVVELQGTELSTNYGNYTLDGLHPNADGMDIITNQFVSALSEKYLPTQE